MLRKILMIFFAFWGLLAMIFYQKLTLEDGRLHVVFCDVGQGDAILIKTPRGSDILVDGGMDKRVLQCLSSHLPFWDRTIEAVMLTHPQADHFAGLLDVIKGYSILYFIDGTGDGDKWSEGEGVRQLYSQIKDKKIVRKTLARGERVKLENGVGFSVLWPEKESLDWSKDPNDMSLVLLLSYGNFNLLLTGDAPSSILSDLTDNLADHLQKIDILKVSHHGSKDGTEEKFIQSARPDLAVISVGRNNRYGHPAKEVIEILRNKDIKTLRTDIDGEIELVSDGKQWLVRTKKSN